MSEDLVLLLTDIVDSTRTNAHWGDAAMAEVWAAHDRLTRDLLRSWRGREVGRSDGFIVVFDNVDDAVQFASAYHTGLAALERPLQARVGLHRGPMSMRENSAADISRGALPFEFNGIAISVAARVMAIAMGGQTLTTRATVDGLSETLASVRSHGHFRLKGVGEPLEVLEVGSANSPFTPPSDSSKAYRVCRRGTNWLPVSEVPNNLPADRDSFVGRRDTLSTIATCFTARARLVTLVGAGGIGKTRLSLRYAWDSLGDYPGGTYFCDLSTARSTDGIIHAVAHGFNVRLGKGDPLDQLTGAIAARGSCLVILDNFEQVVRLAEETLGRWITHAPQALFLVSSRETLGIIGEQTIVVPPLTNEEARHMFEQRVRAAGLTEPMKAEDAAAVSPLVDLLDRLPLAIELAAARVRVLPPRALLKRMGQRFNVLSSRTGRHNRQATLRATLDWSWDLLSRHEQIALTLLSVFEGGFGVDAAEAVFDMSSLLGAPWAGDLLQALVEKSLVRSDLAGRFDLLRTVHDYAEEQLGAMPDGERVGAIRRHAAYFAGLSEHEATADRCVDADNLIAACRRTANIEPTLAAGALLNSWAALMLTGPFRAGLELAQSLENAASGNTDLRMAIDRVMGGALTLLGRADAARLHYFACMRAAESAKEHGMHAQMLARIADLDMAGGNLAAARPALNKALALAIEVADPSAQYTALNGLGKFHLLQSQWQDAHDRYREALAIAEKVGHRRWQGGLHGNLANIERALGRPREALEHFTRAATIAEEVGDRQWEGNARCNLGLLLHEAGQQIEARRELDAALGISREIGHRRTEATTLCNLGLVTEALGEVDAASSFYGSAISLANEMGETLLQGQFYGYSGLFSARVGRASDSHAAFERGQVLLSSSGDVGSLALFLCQRASASAALSNRAVALELLQRVETMLELLDVSAESELGLALTLVRRQVTPIEDRDN